MFRRPCTMFRDISYIFFFFFFQCRHMSIQTSWSPLLWPKCNQRLRLGSPYGTVTLPR
jgi:hypothetical protein